MGLDSACRRGEAEPCRCLKFVAPDGNDGLNQAFLECNAIRIIVSLQRALESKMARGIKGAVAASNVTHGIGRFWQIACARHPISGNGSVGACRASMSKQP
jgi:hypothetical protein